MTGAKRALSASQRLNDAPPSFERQQQASPAAWPQEIAQLSPVPTPPRTDRARLAGTARADKSRREERRRRTMRLYAFAARVHRI
jgi:hypothetical protein